MYFPSCHAYSTALVSLALVGALQEALASHVGLRRAAAASLSGLALCAQGASASASLASSSSQGLPSSPVADFALWDLRESLHVLLLDSLALLWRQCAAEAAAAEGGESAGRATAFPTGPALPSRAAAEARAHTGPAVSSAVKFPANAKALPGAAPADAGASAISTAASSGTLGFGAGETARSVGAASAPSPSSGLLIEARRATVDGAREAREVQPLPQAASAHVSNSQPMRRYPYNSSLFSSVQSFPLSSSRDRKSVV